MWKSINDKDYRFSNGIQESLEIQIPGFSGKEEGKGKEFCEKGEKSLKITVRRIV